MYLYFSNESDPGSGGDDHCGRETRIDRRRAVLFVKGECVREPPQAVRSHGPTRPLERRRGKEGVGVGDRGRVSPGGLGRVGCKDEDGMRYVWSDTCTYIRVNTRYSILFYSILFYSILFFLPVHLPGCRSPQK